MKVNRCPSTLKPGFDTYSAAARKKLFGGRSVSHVLPFMPADKDEVVRAAFLENRKRLSISGVQKKLSLKLEKNKLQLTPEGGRGQYILKPIPDDIMKPEHVPANEHLTMQIAEQVFKIKTAANALIFFKDGEHAYITKRFDYKSEGEKYGVEDFASLSLKTKESHGADFKYDGSYEDLFMVLKKFVGPYLIEAQKLFRLLLFNYVFSNGDAHLKNYALMETDNGDYILSPAYDLLNTRIHVKDADIALKQGMFNEFETKHFEENGYYGHEDFFELGSRAELPERIVKAEIAMFTARRKEVAALVSRSFLDKAMKKKYLELFEERIKRLRQRKSGEKA